jgi:hypothetical protein
MRGMKLYIVCNVINAIITCEVIARNTNHMLIIKSYDESYCVYLSYNLSLYLLPECPFAVPHLGYGILEESPEQPLEIGWIFTFECCIQFRIYLIDSL